MKTAVEWIVEQLNNSTSLTSFVPECDEEYKQEILGIIEQAKAMEKEQIMDAFNSGMNNSLDYFIPFLEPNDESENYYKETFKSE